jgi:hypothetical protein
VRTLIVSDLHLGSGSRADVLGIPALRAPLLEAAREADRLVLLGDIIELRHGPARGALAAGQAALAELGAAMHGREVVICPGNHDYALLSTWLRARYELPSAGPLENEQLLRPADGSPALAAVAQALCSGQDDSASAGPRVTVAYPGLWVRADVYATHGHYLDCHVTIPTLERLGIGAMSRVLARPSESLRCPDDYESIIGPLFAWIDAVARQGPTSPALNGSLTVRAWHALGGGDSTHSASGAGASLLRPLPSLRRQAFARVFPLVIAALNRAGMGPLRADISGSELRRAGLLAMGEVSARLGLRDAYVVFGHTHRAGPLPADREPEWRGRAGARLVNTGCWTYERAFLSPTHGAEQNPYWPGSCVVVEDTGPPRIERLLAHLSRDELARAMAAPRERSAPRQDRAEDARPGERRGGRSNGRSEAAQDAAQEAAQEAPPARTHALRESRPDAAHGRYTR